MAIRSEAVQECFNIALDEHHLAMLGPDKALAHAVVELGDQPVVKTVDVQQRARLGMQAQLSPGDNFADLLERAKSAWQGHKGVG